MFYLLFINFWLCWVFVGAHLLSLVAVSRGYSLAGSVQASLWRPLQLQGTGCTAGGLSSCGTWAKFPLGTCNLPRTGIKLVSPPLAGGVLTTGPSGKYNQVFFFLIGA